MLVGSLSWQGVELIVWLRGSISAKLANGRGFARPENVETSFKFRESNVVICFTKVSVTVRLVGQKFKKSTSTAQQAQLSHFLTTTRNVSLFEFAGWFGDRLTSRQLIT